MEAIFGIGTVVFLICTVGHLDGNQPIIATLAFLFALTCAAGFAYFSKLD